VEIVFSPDAAWHAGGEVQITRGEDGGAALLDEVVFRRVEPVIAAPVQIPQDVLMRPAGRHHFRWHIQQPAGPVGILQDDPVRIHQHDRVPDVAQHVLGLTPSKPRRSQISCYQPSSTATKLSQASPSPEMSSMCVSKNDKIDTNTIGLSCVLFISV